MFQRDKFEMLRFILGVILVLMVGVSLWGSRDFCDCTNDGIVNKIGWKGIQRIANDLNKRDHLLESCAWICDWQIPAVDLVFSRSK
jgi:hypothetical protein